MRAFTRTAGGALIALLCGTTALQADVAAEEVWQSLAGYYRGIGQTVTTDGEAMAGDTLVVSGVKVAGAGGNGPFDLDVPEMRFRETGDGRVEVTAATRITGSVGGPGDAGTGARTRFEIVQTDLRVMVSGSAEDMSYDFTIPGLTARTVDVEVAGQPVQPRFSVNLTEGSGTARMAGAATRVIDSTARFESMSFDLAAPAADAGGDVSARGTLRGVDVLSGLQLPEGIDLNDMEKALAAGYRLETRLRFASGNVNADVRDDGGTTNVQAGLADGQLKMSTSKDGIAYEMRAGPSRAVVQVPALPVPAEIGLDETVLGFSMPVEPGGAAKPFTTVLRVGGLTLSDGIWAMFDPAATLPHDPMAFALDLSGTMRLARSFFGEGVAGQVGKVPAEVETVSLNELRLAAVGAHVAGQGSARIVNGGAQPVPVGSVDLELRGLNALSDRLVAMNLVPQEQAMGMRMMLAMFTVPTGEDSASSRIDSDAEGNVRVNGQVLYKFPRP